MLMEEEEEEEEGLSQDEATAFAASLSPSILPCERELDTTSPALGSCVIVGGWCDIIMIP